MKNMIHVCFLDTESLFGTHSGLELVGMPPEPPEGWNHKRVPPYLARECSILTATLFYTFNCRCSTILR